METKHTPGPWIAPSGGVWTADLETMIATCVSRDVVASMRRTRGNVDGEAGEIAANARLLAAAPELLESLECALWYYDAFRDGSPKGLTECDDMASCRAVLAWAKGGAA